MTLTDPRIARDAETIALFAFRNGPLEDLHTGKLCTHCADNSAYSRINDAEIKVPMQNAMTQVYRYLWMRENDPEAYEKDSALADRFTCAWDNPVPKT